MNKLPLFPLRLPWRVAESSECADSGRCWEILPCTSGIDADEYGPDECVAKGLRCDDSALIVHRVNPHDELVGMLTELASAYHDYHFYRPGSGEKEWQLYLK